MERIWLKNYPKAMPADIDPDAYVQLVDMIDESLAKFADRPGYACMGKTISFGEASEKADALAAYLYEAGLRPGDRMAIMLPNLLQYPIALFACLRLGLVVVNTNPLYTEREMKHQFKDSGAKAILIAENFAHHLADILAETDIQTVLVTGIGDQLGGLKGWLTNLVVRHVKKMVPPYQLPTAVRFNEALARGKGKSYPRAQGKPQDTVVLQYTGGTTGVAKGAELTNRNLVANMLQVRGCMADIVQEGKEVMLTPLPMYHIFSFMVNCLCMLRIGGLNVLIPNPRDQKALLKEMRAHPISMMTGVNTLFNALNNNPEFAELDFSTWKLISGGAMAIQKPVADKWLSITKHAPICEGYGMTESSPVATTNPFDGTGRVGTIGVPIPSTLIRICDETDPQRALPLGERGEIQIKGPQVMKGYYQRPEETAQSLIQDAEGRIWLRTGDVGIMDTDGYIKIVDRLKDMILVSGFNVYPNEIEEVVAAHPKVLEVAAIGVPDPHSGEAPKIFVVKRDPSLTAEELLAFCKENLTGYKIPRHVEFRDELPKTPVGKILRRALRS